MSGRFISFEGPEGCGKSTQARLLAGYLRSRGCKVLFLREPGGTRVSEKIRRILLSPGNHISQVCETLLYMASRAQAVEQIIRPALKKGKIVICDRFLDSTIAYQGYGLGIDIKWIKQLGAFATQGIKPDLTILLDLAVEKGLRHRRYKKDRIESRPLSYHARVREGYLAIARNEPKRIRVVRVRSQKFQTRDNIRKIISEYLS